MRELNSKEIQKVNGGGLPFLLIWAARAMAVEYLTTVRHVH